MHAIVLAGGVPTPDDPLFALTQGRPKALLDMGGRPMIVRVVDGLLGARNVDDVTVVGPVGSELWAADKTLGGKLHFLPGRGSLVGNAVAGLTAVRQRDPVAEAVLLCSADIPHVTGDMVDDLVKACRPIDRLLYYTLVTSDVMEAGYPGARRTYTRAKGGVWVAGGDIFVARMEILDSDHALWEKLTQARKHAWQIARAVGLGTLLKLVFGQLSLEEAAMVAGRLLGSDRPIGLLFTPHAALAMDADKPHQVSLLRAAYNQAGELSRQAVTEGKPQG